VEGFGFYGYTHRPNQTVRTRLTARLLGWKLKNIARQPLIDHNKAPILV
jgi:hypothetical protein